jgi:hypothetical protein
LLLIRPQLRRDQWLGIAFPRDRISRSQPKIGFREFPGLPAKRRQLKRGGRCGLFRARRCK